MWGKVISSKRQSKDYYLILLYLIGLGLINFYNTVKRMSYLENLLTTLLSSSKTNDALPDTGCKEHFWKRI